MNLFLIRQDACCEPDKTGVCDRCHRKVLNRKLNPHQLILDFQLCPAKQRPDYLTDEFLQQLQHLAVGHNKQPSPKMLFGDLTEYYLSQMGVTQDWYKRIKHKLGLVPDCWCDARKEWLNNAHRYWLEEKRKREGIFKLWYWFADKLKKEQSHGSWIHSTPN